MKLIIHQTKRFGREALGRQADAYLTRYVSVSLRRVGGLLGVLLLFNTQPILAQSCEPSVEPCLVQLQPQSSQVLLAETPLEMLQRLGQKASQWKLPKAPWDVDWKKVPLRRRLAKIVRSQSGLVAEIEPEFDYTQYLPRRYRIEGLDVGVVEALATRDGLPVRLRGRYFQDRVLVVDTEAGQEPPILPLPTAARDLLSVRSTQTGGEPSLTCWRGRVRVVRKLGSIKDLAELETLDGNHWTAEVRFSSAEKRKLWHSSIGSFWIEATCWRSAAECVAEDVELLGNPGAAKTQLKPLAGSIQVTMGELFLEAATKKFRSANSAQFTGKDPTGTLQVSLDRAGLSLQGQDWSKDSSARFFGTFSSQLTSDPLGSGSLDLIEGQWEFPVRFQLNRGTLAIQGITKVPGLADEPFKVRLTRPLFLEAPNLLTQSIQTVVQAIFPAFNFSLPLALKQQLLNSGLLTQAELEQLQLTLIQSGDRRSNILKLSNQGATSGEIHTSSQRADDLSLFLGSDNINRCLETQTPKYLPYSQKLSSDVAQGPTILFMKLELDQIEIRSLKLRYVERQGQGQIAFEDCNSAVHWRLGPLQGVEPGAKVSGFMRLQPTLSSGDPNLPVGQLEITKFEFLSPHILAVPASQQSELKAKIVDGLAKLPLKLPDDGRWTVPLGGGPPQKLRLRSLKWLPQGVLLSAGWAASEGDGL